MSPLEHHLQQLQRLQASIEAGEPIDARREIELADWNAAVAEAVYTQDAIDRVNTADEELRPNDE